MTAEDFFIICFFFIMGVSPTIYGISIWTGRSKGWFLVERIPVILPTALFNGSMVFLGSMWLIIFVWSITEINMLFCVAWLLLPTTILLAIFQPRWILPAWYHWLEKNHAAILPVLREEARQIGAKEWQRRVATQEGLEGWVEEVYHKHNR